MLYDAFSLGATFYEVLKGDTMFKPPPNANIPLYALQKVIAAFDGTFKLPPRTNQIWV